MKKSNLVLIIAVVLLAFFFFAFQKIMHDYIDKVDRNKVNLAVKEEVRNISVFRNIYNEEGAYIYFIQDSLTQLKIKAPENLLSFVKVKMSGDTLRIENTKEIRKRDSVRIFIHNPILEGVEMHSGTTFETLKQVSGKDLRLLFRNESYGVLDLSYESVRSKATSGAKVNIKGNSNQVDFSN